MQTVFFSDDCALRPARAFARNPNNVDAASTVLPNQYFLLQKIIDQVVMFKVKVLP